MAEYDSTCRWEDTALTKIEIKHLFLYGYINCLILKVDQCEINIMCDKFITFNYLKDNNIGVSN